MERLLREVKASREKLREASGYLGPGRIQGEPDIEEVQAAIVGVCSGIAKVRDALQTYYGRSWIEQEAGTEVERNPHR